MGKKRARPWARPWRRMWERSERCEKEGCSTYGYDFKNAKYLVIKISSKFK